MRRSGSPKGVSTRAVLPNYSTKYFIRGQFEQAPKDECAESGTIVSHSTKDHSVKTSWHPDLRDARA
nr:hypothetical protein [Tanacetum cinerariifolium]